MFQKKTYSNQNGSHFDVSILRVAVKKVLMSVVRLAIEGPNKQW